VTGVAIVRSEPQGVCLGEEPGVAAQARVRILCAGVCGTDLQIARGDRDDRARILGHEAVGELETRPGEWVVFNPVDRLDQDRILGHSYDGVFRSTFPLVDGAGDPELVRIPAGLPVELCALCEPVAAALYGWELAGERARGDRVGVWGAGPIGLIHIRLALAKGMSVRLFHRHRSRLDWARSNLFGAAPDYRLSGSAEPAELDLAFVCSDRTGTGDALTEAVQALADDGLIVLVGGIAKGHEVAALPGVDPSAVRRLNVRGGCGEDGGTVRATARDGRAVRLTGHRGTSARQLLGAHRAIAADQEFFGSLVTHVVDPDAAVELINDRCAHRQQDQTGAEIVKIVVRF
jgi:threonine dehydrogenase-like Zn-dependent dehydrogenase